MAASMALNQKKQKAPLAVRSDFSCEAIEEISTALNQMLADTFALYLKTKNFHWHMSGAHDSSRRLCGNSELGIRERDFTSSQLERLICK